MTDETPQRTSDKPKTGKKRGRKRTKTPDTFTPAQLRRIDSMARDQCKDTTIATALGVPIETFRNEFRERTEKQRAVGKVELHRLQMKRARAGSDTMLIWTGKQHLEQSDQQAVAVTGSLTLNDAGVALGIAKGGA